MADSSGARVNPLHIEIGKTYIDYGGRNVKVTGVVDDEYGNKFDVLFDDGAGSVLLPDQIICEKTGEMRETVINGKWKLRLPEHRYARYQIEQNWEPERLDSMHKHLKEGDYIIDVGAEEGDFPALFASWGCRVGMIEPQALVWPNIKAIWEANELEPPVFCFEGFAADTNSEVYAPTTAGLWPMSADGEVIGNHGFHNLSERPDLNRMTIDVLAAIYGPPDAITIDVEGAEYEVIMGAEKTLREHKPLVWISEHEAFMYRMYDHYLADLHNVLEAWGYEKELLAYDHELHVLWKPK